MGPTEHDSDQQPVEVSWQCPYCVRSVKAPSEPSLFWVVRTHIKDHIEQAVKDALEWERLHPGAVANAARGELRLTEGDKKFLTNMKVDWRG